jgi:hypothetical protein
MTYLSQADLFFYYYNSAVEGKTLGFIMGNDQGVIVGAAKG